jgi:flagellar protein FliJ
MRKFKFKFDTLLKARKNREEDALRVLGEAQRVYQGELARKAGLEKQLEEGLIRRESLGARGTGISAFLLEQDYITGTKQWIIQAQQAIVRASRGVEKALRTYLHARRQTRVMELIYEKHYVEFKKERAKKEQKELEDFAVMRSRFKSDDEEGEVA